MTTLKKLAAGTFVFLAAATVFAGSPQLPLLNDPVDISGDFRDFSDTYFLADHLTRFDPATAENLNRATVNLRVIRAGETGKTLFPSADD